MNNKTLTLLGFAAKAGALVFGSDLSVKAVRCGKAKSVFVANDISFKSHKEIMFHCEKNRVEAFELKDINMTELGKAVGRKCGVVAVTDGNFSSSIISSLTSDV